MNFNVAQYLPARAASDPDRTALVWSTKRGYERMSFAELEAMSNRYAHALSERGFARGDRVLMMVRQGPELVALTFGLFKIGAVPVLIDPGMGRKNFLACIEDARPTHMVGIPAAIVARHLFRRPFASVKTAICTERRWWTFAPALPEAGDGPEFPLASTERDDLAAILFTSGSTGPPKGVLYTHGIFDGQVRVVQSMYDITPDEVAVAAFPLFALFSVSMGTTCVIPDMDPAKPAQCDPARIVAAIRDHDANLAFGSPAVWTVVVRYCEAHDIEFPSLTRMLMFGAAIPPRLMERWEAIMPNGRVHTPYGATEALPVASISSEEVLSETAAESRKGRGICVGRAIDDVDVRIIGIDDGPIERWTDDLPLPHGAIGEICVRGPMVTRGYDNKPRHDALAKIVDGDTFWHRMGDVGYFDDRGRLWFCGRKAHRVVTDDGTMFTVPCEAVFNEHPAVYRSALVGLGHGTTRVPAVVIEPEPGHLPRNGTEEDALRHELLELAKSSELTASLSRIYFESAFPVDRRHNAKIHREELAERLTRRVGGG